MQNLKILIKYVLNYAYSMCRHINTLITYTMCQNHHNITKIEVMVFF